MASRRIVSVICALCMMVAMCGASPALAREGDATQAGSAFQSGTSLDEPLTPAVSQSEIASDESPAEVALDESSGEPTSEPPTQPAVQDEPAPEPPSDGGNTPTDPPQTTPTATPASATPTAATGTAPTTAPNPSPAPTGAAPTATPFPFPEQMQILTDRRQVWTGMPVVYTIIGLSKDSVLAVYDPATPVNDPDHPVLLACTDGYPDPYLQIPRMTWNEELLGWQFAYTPQQAGPFQLMWRLYADGQLLEWRDYTEMNAQDVITAYAPPTVQVYSMDSSGHAGDQLELVVDTDLSVTSVTLVDESGAPLAYVDSVTCEEMTSRKRWTCVYRIYDPGTHRISARASALLEYVEKTAQSPLVSVGVLPSVTPLPSPGDLPTLEPDATLDPDATEAPAPATGYVRFKQVPSADAQVGDDITLNLDVEFAGYDGSRINYTDPAFYDYVDYIEVQPEISADPYPFVVDESLQRIIIRSYEEMQQQPFSFNVKVKSSLSNGTYTFNFTLRYRLKGRTDPEPDATEAGMVFVSGAKEPSSGGGGGGGGGGGVTLPATQAKLMVESLRTDPASPHAGDTFDVILTLRNTNEKQYVQNITLTYATDNDVLMPANGSSSFYIDKIGAGKTYELTLPVTARPDMPDTPVKLNLSIDYEDKQVNKISATQSMVINVRQVQKLKLDELVAPQGEVIVGESASFTMNVINSGRTTLYNVSAAMLESDQFMTAGSAYVGNLEAGSSKEVELDIYPNAEGPVEGTLRVTYEDANGNQSHEDTPFSIYASAMQEDTGYYEPVIEPTPEPEHELAGIVARLPWWVYGAAGLFVICIVMLIALAVRRRSMDSMMDYDDE